MRLCKTNPNCRYSAKEALNHPWITRKFDCQIPVNENDMIYNKIAKRKLKQTIRVLVFISLIIPDKLTIDLNSELDTNMPPELSYIKSTSRLIFAINNPKTPNLSFVGKSVSFRKPKTIQLPQFKAVSKYWNTPQHLKDKGIINEWEKYDSNNSEKSKFSDSSKGSVKNTQRREHAGSIGSYVEEIKIISPQIQSQNVTKKRKSVELGKTVLPPLTRSELTAMRIQKSVMAKEALNKRKSTFMPSPLLGKGIMMQQTKYGGFIKTLSDNNVSARRLPTANSSINLKPDQAGAVLNLPNKFKSNTTTRLMKIG